MLQSSFYYARLGAEYKVPSDGYGDDVRELTDREPFLNLRPNQFVSIRTHEAFSLSYGLRAEIHQIGSLSRLGLEVVSGGVVDPGFPGPGQIGYLNFGLKNMNESTASIRINEIIVKIEFFDVGDAEIEPVKPGILASKFAASGFKIPT